MAKAKQAAVRSWLLESVFTPACAHQVDCILFLPEEGQVHLT
jgi:hypothetical protein